MSRNDLFKLLSSQEFSETSDSIAKSMIEIMKMFSPDDENGEDVLNALLNLDDENLKVIGPLFLQEFEEEFNDQQVQLTLTALMSQYNISYEEIMDFFTELISQIDDEPDLTNVKKDFLKALFICMKNGISECEGLTRRIVDIPIEVVSEKAKIPTYANLGDAAADLYSIEDYEIKPGEQVMIKTGIKVAIPYGYAILIQPRSGISSKSKLRICNTPGLIDSGYRGEICVLMENIESPIKDISYDKELGLIPLYGKTYTIEAGERIAQMRLVEVPTMAFSKVQSVDVYESGRGENGFGSTGMK